MSSAKAQPIVWRNLRGENSADAPTELPPDSAAFTFQVLLEPRSLGRRRPSMVAVSLTSGPSGAVYQLARIDSTRLMAMSGADALHLWTSGTWTTITASDTVTSFATSRPQAVMHNKKLFVAYQSNMNRLHVYDPAFSTSVLRRVGLTVSGAPSVANTGAGSYAATIRYYKIQWKIINSGDTVATSELSAATSFTPSGTGTAARVTKPTTVDSATHWVVFGSADGLTFYNISGNLAVGTTTYDDSATPSTYATLGAIAPSAGLYIPWPAVKYLLSDGSRLLGANSWISDATSGLTPTTPVGKSRVWFTLRTGALDDTGEDEAVANTVSVKNWVDCGEQDGDEITGLAGPLDGVVYVFKQRSIWRLIPTGLVEQPYRPERMTSAVGAVWQDGITMGEDGNGNPAIYFYSLTGPKRLVAGMGVEDLGADIRSYGGEFFSFLGTPIACWDQVRRVLWWFQLTSRETYAFQPQFESRSADGVRGGWTRHQVTAGLAAGSASACLFEVNSILVPWVGARVVVAETGAIGTLSGNLYYDIDPAVPLGALVQSPVFQPQGALMRLTIENPVLEWTYPGAVVNHSVTVAAVVGGPMSPIYSQTGTTTTTATQAVLQEKIEAIAPGDVTGFQITVTWDADTSGATRPRINSVTVPVRGQERV